MQRKAIIIGATGRIGQALVRELSSLYATVIVISRTPPKYISENTHVYTLSDFDNLTQTLSSVSLDEQTDAFCCLSAKFDETGDEVLEKIYHSYPKAFAKACHDKGVRRFFLLNMSDKAQYVGTLHQELTMLDWQMLSVFLVDKLTLPEKNYSLNVLSKKALALLQQFLPHDKPLTPKQVGISMALVAFWTLYDKNYVAILKPEFVPNKKQHVKGINYVSHEQMLNLTSVEKF